LFVYRADINQVTDYQMSIIVIGMNLMLRLAQSSEDGSMPIVAACFDSSAENGSFWAPSKFGGFKGPAKKITFEKASTDERNKTILWETSEDACGLFDI
jgi:hypothetical protein